MAFQKKTWVDRLTEFATRRIITNATTRQETLVEVARAEGEIYEPGDAFNAETMNDLEDRINDAFEEVGKGVGVVDTYDNVMDMISHGEIEEETFVSITDDSDDDSIPAIAIDYDNTTSGMTATEVQGAIDELSTHITALEQTESVSVTGNGVKTASTLLGELARIINVSRVTTKSFIIRETSSSISKYAVEVVSNSGVLETSLVIVEGGVFKVNIININTSSGTGTFGQATLNGYTSRDGDVIPNGEKFYLYY